EAFCVGGGVAWSGGLFRSGSVGGAFFLGKMRPSLLPADAFSRKGKPSASPKHGHFTRLRKAPKKVGRHTHSLPAIGFERNDYDPKTGGARHLGGNTALTAVSA